MEKKQNTQASAVAQIPGKLAGMATMFTESAKGAKQQKIAEGQAQQIMENRESMGQTMGGYRRKRKNHVEENATRKVKKKIT